ncbi:MAG: HEPN domain-containing protein [Prevotella sp.]|jgi:uncharacterized protein (UPF0332 family)|nr:HEPN domain-containing protein [Prevotella sp.]
MSLKEEDRRILVELELEKADKTFKQVAVLQREGYWDTMANRLYYSLFHAVSALLINDQREVGSHKGAAIRFHQYYVKTGLFSEEEGSFYSQMETLREKSDYNCFFNVTETDIVSKVTPASAFIEKVKRYVAGDK